MSADKTFKVLSASVFLILIAGIGMNVVQAALVPCGNEGQPACTLCDFFKLAKNIITYLTEIASALAVLMIAYNGFRIMTAGGSEDRMKKGKENMWLAIWGVIIVLAAWLLVGTVINVLGGGKAIPWSEIKCG